MAWISTQTLIENLKQQEPVIASSTPKINDNEYIETNKEIISNSLWLLSDKQITKYANASVEKLIVKSGNFITLNMFRSTIIVYKSFLGMMTIRNIENTENTENNNKLELYVEIGRFECDKQTAMKWKHHFSNKQNMKLYTQIKSETMIFSKNILYLENTIAMKLKEFINSINWMF